MNSFVYDTSAVMAHLNKERGHELVGAALMSPGFISDVNVAELVTKLADSGMPEDEIRDTLAPLNLSGVHFDSETAYITGLLRPSTKAAGLSLGDRACLALGMLRELPVLTSDRAWRKVPVEIPVEIQFIR